MRAANPPSDTIGETSFKKKIRTLTVVSLLGFIAACGGPGNNAKVPEVEAAGAGAGATMKDIGDHVVDFSPFTTDQLPSDIAGAYNVVRSQDRAMLNVSIIAKAGNAPVPATLELKTVNLTGQLKNVTMRRVDEQEAIYYIGVTAIANRETLILRYLHDA
jgi:hypothetical protein